jgi:hypothetical protein
MSRFDDDRTAMDDGFGSDAVVTAFVDDLRSLAGGEPPEPSAQLAALLAGATPLPRSAPLTALPPLRHLRHRRVVGLVAASMLVAGTVAAAAGGRLPQPAQRLVSDVVNHVTPFEVPAEPHDGVPSPTPSSTTPWPSAAGERPHPVAPAPTASQDAPDPAPSSAPRPEPSEPAEHEGGGAVAPDNPVPRDDTAPAGGSQPAGTPEPSESGEPRDGRQRSSGAAPSASPEPNDSAEPSGSPTPTGTRHRAASRHRTSGAPDDDASSSTAPPSGGTGTGEAGDP